jgi:hypothetical protein
MRSPCTRGCSLTTVALRCSAYCWRLLCTTRGSATRGMRTANGACWRCLMRQWHGQFLQLWGQRRHCIAGAQACTEACHKKALRLFACIPTCPSASLAALQAANTCCVAAAGGHEPQRGATGGVRPTGQRQPLALDWHPSHVATSKRDWLCNAPPHPLRRATRSGCLRSLSSTFSTAAPTTRSSWAARQAAGLLALCSCRQQAAAKPHRHLL